MMKEGGECNIKVDVEKNSASRIIIMIFISLLPQDDKHVLLLRWRQDFELISPEFGS